MKLGLLFLFASTACSSVSARFGANSRPIDDRLLQTSDENDLGSSSKTWSIGGSIREDFPDGSAEICIFNACVDISHENKKSLTITHPRGKPVTYEGEVTYDEATGIFTVTDEDGTVLFNDGVFPKSGPYFANLKEAPKGECLSICKYYDLWFVVIASVLGIPFNFLFSVHFLINSLKALYHIFLNSQPNSSVSTRTSVNCAKWSLPMPMFWKPSPMAINGLCSHHLILPSMRSRAISEIFRQKFFFESFSSMVPMVSSIPMI